MTKWIWKNSWNGNNKEEKKYVRKASTCPFL
jgi:hypothetical protein